MFQQCLFPWSFRGPIAGRRGRVASVAVRALRGATTVDHDSADEVKGRAADLLTALLAHNGVNPDDLISVFFTATDDISSVAPAAGIREMGLTDVPLLCAVEMRTDNGLDHCIRLMAHVETDKPRAEIRHLFLGRATVLRPDLIESGADGSNGPAQAGRTA